RRALTLPNPPGPYAVGRVETDWSDPETPAELAPEAGAHRHLVVWIWYPATETSHGTSEYLPAELAQADERARGILFGKLLGRDLSKVRTHSIANAAVAQQQPSYPVLL